MDEKETLGKAMRLFHEAYRFQMQGKLDDAVRLYRESISAHPTAEAHTFLRLDLQFPGRYEEAIAECQRGDRGPIPTSATLQRYSAPISSGSAPLREDGALA
jgi:hypothetical protein